MRPAALLVAIVVGSASGCGGRGPLPGGADSSTDNAYSLEVAADQVGGLAGAADRNGDLGQPGGASSPQPPDAEVAAPDAPQPDAAAVDRPLPYEVGAEAALRDAVAEGAPPDAVADVGPPDAVPPDVIVAGVSPCLSGLVGAAPFGCTLDIVDLRAGDRPVDAPGALVQIYFPRGRVPGATAILAFPITWDPQGIAQGKPATIGADGSIQRIEVSDGITTIVARLPAGAAELVGTEDVQIPGPSHPSDLPLLPRDVRLVPRDPLPPFRLETSTPFFGPLSRVWFVPNAALAPDAQEHLRLMLGTFSFPMAVTRSYSGRPLLVWSTGLEASNAGCFPPSEVLTWDTSSVRDVLGRPAVATVPQPLMTSAVVEDLTFARRPPDGAIAVGPPNLGWHHEPGVLRIPANPARAFSALVALGSAAGAAAVHLRLFYERWPGPPAGPLRLSIVNRNWDVAEVTLPDCALVGRPLLDEPPCEVTVAVPTASVEIWLAIEDDRVPEEPGSDVSSDSPGQVWLTGVRFESYEDLFGKPPRKQSAAPPSARTGRWRSPYGTESADLDQPRRRLRP